MSITYQQLTEIEIQCTITNDNGSVTSMPLILVEGEWQKLNGEVVELPDDVIWLTEEQKAATLAEEQAAQAKIEQEQLKREGTEIDGYVVSLCESNQNGLASIKAGDDLAQEVGSTIFPINFRARCAGGEIDVPLADRSAFNSFALAFIQARQPFFQ